MTGGRRVGLFGKVQEFLVANRPDRRLATTALRTVFASMFAGQLAVAAALGVVVLLLNGQPAGRSSVLGPVLAVIALLQCGLGVFLPELLARGGGKGRVLSATLLAAVLLASPGWFLMLALITGQAALPLMILLSLLASAYALGFLLTGRFARRVGG